MSDLQLHLSKELKNKNNEMTRLKCPLKNSNCSVKCICFVPAKVYKEKDEMKVSDPGCSCPLITGSFRINNN